MRKAEFDGRSSCRQVAITDSIHSNERAPRLAVAPHIDPPPDQRTFDRIVRLQAHGLESIEIQGLLQ
ncbi:hypothetical protein V5E97_23450 [Singulisphaera sp. Ch08]|uniref:Uncharacterized protein n=1 Tax=Singulisphaera sp. Ch08 TaxID=3120278 RepID=A0AAU7C853_9BACT